MVSHDDVTCKLLKYPTTGSQVGINPDRYRSSSTSSSTTGSRACARAREEEAYDRVLDDLGAYYCRMLDRPTCPAIVRADMRWAMRQGMEPSVIAAAIDDTTIAPAPSWRYAMAIIVRCIREGCKTLEAWDDRADAHRNKAVWRYRDD